MPPDNIAMIMEAIKDMREQQRHDCDRLYDKLEELQRCGSNVARNNAEKLSPLCELVAKHEAFINRQAGQVAMIGGLASVITAAAIKIGATLLSKI